MHLLPDQLVAIVVVAEAAREDMAFVLPDAAGRISRYAGRDRAVPAIDHDVNEMNLAMLEDGLGARNYQHPPCHSGACRNAS